MIHFTLQIKRKSFWREYRLLFLALLILSTFFFTAIISHFTHSALTDRKQSKDNAFAAGTWGGNDSKLQTENILAPSQEIIAGVATSGVIETTGAESLFEITLTGELNVPEGFTADAVQILKTINLSGDERVLSAFKNFEINLADIKIEKEGEIDILVSDLKITGDAKAVSAKDDDIVFAIIVSKKLTEDASVEVIPAP